MSARWVRRQGKTVGSEESVPGRADPTFVFGGARFGWSLFFFAGATWFVVLVVRLAAVALGIRTAADLSGVLAAVVLVPAMAACVAPLLEAGVALLRGSRSAGRWSRIMAEAGAALVFASLASAYEPALWPGLVFLAVATAWAVWWACYAGAPPSLARTPRQHLRYSSCCSMTHPMLAAHRSQSPCR